MELESAGVSRWIETLARGRGEVADVFFERRREATIEWSDGEVVRTRWRADSGVAARWTNRREERLFYVSGPPAAAAREAVRSLQASLAQPALPIKPASDSEPEIRSHPPSERWRRRLAAVFARHAPRHRFRWRWIELEREVMPARGTPCAHTRRLVSLEGTFVAASRRGDERRGFSFHAPETDAIADELKTTLAAAAAPREGSVPCGDGENDVVLANGCAAVLFHEILSHALETGAPSPLEGLTEARLAVADLEVREDPTRLDLFGGYEWDDEGTRARPAKLLDAGKLAGRLSGHAGAAESAGGHARRASAADPPLVRGSNVVVSPGQASREDLSRRLSNGLWIEDVDGGSVELSAGTFRLRFPRARRIRRSRVADELSGGVLAGEILGVLKSVETGLGREARPYRAFGWCARHAQVLPVQGAAPDILIRRVAVRGER